MLCHYVYCYLLEQSLSAVLERYVAVYLVACPLLIPCAGAVPREQGPVFRRDLQCECVNTCPPAAYEPPVNTCPLPSWASAPEYNVRMRYSLFPK